VKNALQNVRATGQTGMGQSKLLELAGPGYLKSG